MLLQPFCDVTSGYSTDVKCFLPQKLLTCKSNKVFTCYREMGCGYEEGEGENYECRLSQELQQTAQRELREDEATRSHALRQLRQWVNMHPDIHSCRKGRNRSH